MTVGAAMRSKVAVAAVAAAVLASLGPAEGQTSLGSGITRRTIKIGVHVPMTGAAPLPSKSAQQGADVYWKWLRARGKKINGRYVEAVVKNDNYNPSQAVAVCKELVEDDGVFLLTGIIQGSGVNQVQACARYAASVGVPYISLGMSRVGLERLPRYFAVTATWPKEARLLADFLVSERRARRETNAIVWGNNPTFEDTHDAFVRAMSRRKAPVAYDRSVPKNATQTEAQTVVSEMKALGVDNVFMMTSPVWFLQVLQAARTQEFKPLWTGISTIATTGDTVPRVGCRNGNLGRSRFLSPLPAFADRDEFDRRHDRAMQAVYGERGDAITWLGWAGSKAIRRLLEGAGRDLSRGGFARTTENDRRVVTGIFPPFGFTPRDHFGGRAVHLIKANCQRERWVTKRRFVRDF